MVIVISILFVLVLRFNSSSVRRFDRRSRCGPVCGRVFCFTVTSSLILNAVFSSSVR